MINLITTMGKIEIDLPEFGKELVISVTLRKDDGAVSVLKQDAPVPTAGTVEKKKTGGSGPSVSGNMMDSSF